MAKFIKFVDSGEVHDKHPVYLIKNKKSQEAIGRIFWYKPWRMYVADYAPLSVWSTGCLKDVIAFIEAL